MKASLAGGGFRAVERARPTTESRCCAVDSTGVQGLWPCLERKCQRKFCVAFSCSMCFCHNSRIQQKRLSFLTSQTHLTSQSHAKQKPYNSLIFVVESLVVTAHGEIQADASATHHGPITFLIGSHTISHAAISMVFSAEARFVPLFFLLSGQRPYTLGSRCLLYILHFL